MARVTVEDCLEKIPNRFQLVLVATKRARHLAMSSAEPFVAWENDKAAVVALREIAGGFIGLDSNFKATSAVVQEPDHEPQG